MAKHEHTHHGCGGHMGHGMGHGSAAQYLRRFWIVTVLLVPLVFSNDAVTGFFGMPMLPFARWIGMVVSTVIFGFALVFFQHAWHEIKARSYGMMTLVSLAVGSGYLFSLAAAFIPELHANFFLEISTLIWVLLFGHYLESRSGAAAGNALAEVAKLLPKQAHRLVDGVEEDVDITTLRSGDVVLVKPGEKVPADGTVEAGSANVDEALISGESKPLSKQVGSALVAGSICLDGSLTVRLSRVGEHSTIGQIKTLIARAQGTKPRSQRIADQASGLLTFVALGTAVATVVVWWLVLGQPLVFALTLAITVLVIACPHALGLAIPTVTTIATSLSVHNGAFIKDLGKIEVLKRTQWVVFDKTGTLTEGRFGVTDVIPFGDETHESVLWAAASLERNSAHVIARAIVRHAEDAGVQLSEPSKFRDVAGKGITGVLDGVLLKVGSAMLVETQVGQGDVHTTLESLYREGKTVVLVADEKRVRGVLALADAIKPESYDAVRALHQMGIKVAMVTGDHEAVARTVARALSIDTYFAGVLPQEKYVHITALQEGGETVAMVGDGVNDAPALMQADVGVAIGAGTDVALEAGDVVLTRSNPLDVIRLLKLSRAVYSKMVQNLFWALGYNVIAIPAAAGVFAVWGFFLRPEIGAFLMSLSTVIVVANALLLRRINLTVTTEKAYA